MMASIKQALQVLFFLGMVLFIDLYADYIACTALSNPWYADWQS